MDPLTRVAIIVGIAMFLLLIAVVTFGVLYVLGIGGNGNSTTNTSTTSLTTTTLSGIEQKVATEATMATLATNDTLATISGAVATESTLSALNDKVPSSGLASNSAVTGISDVVATETTLSALNAKVPSSGLATRNNILTANSTSTALGSLETFTGTASDVYDYDSISVNITTDLDGTLYVDHSSDGTNWDFTSTRSHSGASSSSVHNIHAQARYIRVRFSNIESSAQSALRLQTIGKVTSTASSSRYLSSLNSYSGQLTGFNSSLNTSIAAPYGATSGTYFLGTWENVTNYTSIVVALKASTTCIVKVMFSPDGENADSTLTYTFDPSEFNDVHKLTVTRPYYRLFVCNDSADDQEDGYTRITTLIGDHGALTSILNTTIQGDADAVLTRSVLTGAHANGRYENVPVDEYGNLYVSIRGPTHPFGSVHTENLTPVFQFDGVYALNSLIVSDNSNAIGLGGAASVSESSIVLDTETGLYGDSTIQTVKRLHYKAGQGVICRFTALFTKDAATGSYQVAGIGHIEDGYYFAYKGSTFGILHVNRRYRQIVSLTVSTAGSSGSVTVTLNDTESSTITIGGTSTEQVAYDIAAHSFTGWSTYSHGSTVVFIANSAGTKDGTYSFNVGATGAAGSFSTNRSGTSTVDVNDTETFIPQTSWNMDVMDGTSSTSNPSGSLLDPGAYNVYQIGMQYLGAGALQFSILTSTDERSTKFETVHIIRNPNTLTDTHVGNPSFPFTASSYKTAASATSIVLKIGSVMGAVEGRIHRHGPLVTYDGANSALGTTLTSLIMIRNAYTFNDVANQNVINIQSINAAASGANNAVIRFFILRNPTITGRPIFNWRSDGKSCATYSTTTGITVASTDNTNRLYSFQISETGQAEHSFASDTEEFAIQPGDIICVCAQTTTSTASVAVSLNTREDQ